MNNLLALLWWLEHWTYNPTSPGSIPGVLPIYNLSWATWASPWYRYTGIFFRSSGSPVTSQWISIILSSLIAGVPQTSLLWCTWATTLLVNWSTQLASCEWVNDEQRSSLHWLQKKNNLFVKVKTALLWVERTVYLAANVYIYEDEPAVIALVFQIFRCHNFLILPVAGLVIPQRYCSDLMS